MSGLNSPPQQRSGDGNGSALHPALQHLDEAKLARLNQRLEPKPLSNGRQPNSPRQPDDQNTASTQIVTSSTDMGTAAQPLVVELVSGGSNSNYSVQQQLDAWSRSREANEGENSSSNAGAEKNGSDEELRSAKRSKIDLDLSAPSTGRSYFLFLFRP
jgi:hypothetical protein